MSRASPRSTRVTTGAAASSAGLLLRRARVHEEGRPGAPSGDPAAAAAHLGRCPRPQGASPRQPWRRARAPGQEGHGSGPRGAGE
eukprot:7882024-Alexandrium_andersonii.AAC.1